MRATTGRPYIVRQMHYWLYEHVAPTMCMHIVAILYRCREGRRAICDRPPCSWARTEHGATRFTAAHVTRNAASGNVLRKCGFKFVRYGQYGRYDGSEMFDASFYELTIE